MALSKKNRKRAMEKFHEEYLNPTSPIFLERNNVRIKKFIKHNAGFPLLRIKDIVEYKKELTHLSKNVEKKILRGRPRQLSHRPWLTFGPNNIRKSNIHFHVCLKCVSIETVQTRELSLSISLSLSLSLSLSFSFSFSYLDLPSSKLRELSSNGRESSIQDRRWISGNVLVLSSEGQGIESCLSFSPSRTHARTILISSRGYNVSQKNERSCKTPSPCVNSDG